MKPIIGKKEMKFIKKRRIDWKEFDRLCKEPPLPQDLLFTTAIITRRSMIDIEESIQSVINKGVFSDGKKNINRF